MQEVQSSNLKLQSAKCGTLPSRNVESHDFKVEITWRIFITPNKKEDFESIQRLREFSQQQVPSINTSDSSRPQNLPFANFCITCSFSVITCRQFGTCSI